MEIREVKPKLLPPPEGHCRICAIRHAPDMPHNADTVFYQMRFLLRYKRDGTWADAIAHCEPHVQAAWKNAIEDRGRWTEPPDGIEPVAEPIDG